MESELRQLVQALFAFLASAGVSAPVAQEADPGEWIPLAEALHACGYESPHCLDDEVADYTQTHWIPIDGQATECIELADFCWAVAPYCQEAVAHELGAAFLDMDYYRNAKR
jgi:hypothetical protein